MTAAVAVLCARRRSIYHTIAVCDVYDAARDARTYTGALPIVAHPPCATWGQLRHQANRDPDRHALGPWCVAQVRRCGGVLEHPYRSQLWPECWLPEPGQRDAWGGWTLPIRQSDWGHCAAKRTRLYIVGCAPAQLPPLPLRLGESSHVVSRSGNCRDLKQRRRPELGRAARESTPPELARWLIALALRCKQID